MAIRRRYPAEHPCFDCSSLPDHHVHLGPGDHHTGAPPGACVPDDEAPPEVDCNDTPDHPSCAAAESYLDLYGDEAIAAGLAATQVSGLPYPILQFEEVSAHTVTRDKIVTNKGISAYFWDDPITPSTDFWRRLFRPEQMRDLFKTSNLHNLIIPDRVAHDEAGPQHDRDFIYGFPYLADIYALTRRTALGDIDALGGRLPNPSMDPLRWGAGKVWAYTPWIRADWNRSRAYDRHLFDPGIEQIGAGDISLGRTRTVVTQSLAINTRLYEWSFVYDLDRSVFPASWSENARGFMTNKRNRFYSLDFESSGLAPKTIGHNADFGTYVDEEFWLRLDGEIFRFNPPGQALNFARTLLKGYTRTAGPMRLIEEPTGLHEQREDLISKLFGDGVNTGMFSEGNSQAVYYDYAHKLRMPLFEREDSQVAFSSKLSAEVLLHSNFIESATVNSDEVYKRFTGPEVDLTNIYRYFRSYVNEDPDCERKNYLDEILKFTSENITEHFSEISNRYRGAFPMVAQIKFDTVQMNHMADLFKRYGMDKYFLDLWEKYEDAADISDGSIAPSLDGTTPGKIIGVDMFGKSSIANASVLFTEFLEQAVRPGRDLDIDRNYWTSDPRTRSPLQNEKMHFRSPRINSNMHSFMAAMVPDRMVKFNETMFPLGVWPTDDRIDEDSEWSLAVNLLNKELFRAKLGSMAWDEYTDRPSDDRNVGSDFSTMGGRYRTFQDIIEGKLAYSEVIAYVVRKYDVTEGVENARLIQKFYFADSSKVQDIDFLDSQIKYNKKYAYYISAITCVIGSKYNYQMLSEHDDGTQPGMEFIDEFILDPNWASENEEAMNLLLTPFQSAWDDRGGLRGQRGLSVKCRARHAPSFIFVEVPYFKKTIHTVDRPPMPPQVDIVPYKSVDTGILGYHRDDPTRILINLTPSSGQMLADPVNMGVSTDTAMIETMRDAQDTRVRSVSDISLDDARPRAPSFRKVEYGGDSLPDAYQVFVLEDPINPITGQPSAPMSYGAFNPAQGATVYSYSATDGSLHYNFYIKPNVKYYMCFRAVDSIAGFSNPTEVFYVQLVKYADGMFLVVEDYQFPKPLATLSRKFKRAIRITPTTAQRGILEAAADGLVENSIWNKTYRMRVKSKRTGKTVDVDFSFDLTDAVRDPAPGGEPPEQEPQPCGTTDTIPEYMPEEGIPIIPRGAESRLFQCPGPVNVLSRAVPNLNIIAANFDLQSGRTQRNETNDGCLCPGTTEHISLHSPALVFQNQARPNSPELCLEPPDWVNLCPANTTPVWIPRANIDNPDPGFHYVGCQCIDPLILCGGDCVQPDCPDGQFLDPASCECREECPAPSVWRDGQCHCPEGMIPDPFHGCITPSPETCLRYNPCALGSNASDDFVDALNVHNQSMQPRAWREQNDCPPNCTGSMQCCPPAGRPPNSCSRAVWCKPLTQWIAEGTPTGCVGQIKTYELCEEPCDEAHEAELRASGCSCYCVDCAEDFTFMPEDDDDGFVVVEEDKGEPPELQPGQDSGGDPLTLKEGEIDAFLLASETETTTEDVVDINTDDAEVERQRLEQEAQEAEANRLAEEEAEARRRQNEREAQEAEAERQRVERERLERERQRLEQDRVERERLERERLERERLAREAQDALDQMGDDFDPAGGSGLDG
jgi:hypothetical protein